GYIAAEILLERYNVDAIIGPVCCAEAARVSMLAERKRVPVISWG
ncbi:unnamed protein product, partial [Discosporangium mesarthrocarpum]